MFFFLIYKKYTEKADSFKKIKKNYQKKNPKRNFMFAFNCIGQSKWKTVVIAKIYLNEFLIAVLKTFKYFLDSIAYTYFFRNVGAKSIDIKSVNEWVVTKFGCLGTRPTLKVGTGRPRYLRSLNLRFCLFTSSKIHQTSVFAFFPVAHYRFFFGKSAYKISI